MLVGAFDAARFLIVILVQATPDAKGFEATRRCVCIKHCYRGGFRPPASTPMRARAGFASPPPISREGGLVIYIQRGFVLVGVFLFCLVSICFFVAHSARISLWSVFLSLGGVDEEKAVVWRTGDCCCLCSRSKSNQ